MSEQVEPTPAELGPLEKPYTYLPVYADVEYVDGKLRVARGILSRTTDPEMRRGWMQTVDILLAQRTALASVTAPVVIDLEDPYFDGQTLPVALLDYGHVHSTTGVCVKNVGGHFCTPPAPTEEDEHDPA